MFESIMSSKIIIITTVILLIASFSVLFVIEAKNHNYDYKKSGALFISKIPATIRLISRLKTIRRKKWNMNTKFM